jgi:hypothetical protein
MQPRRNDLCGLVRCVAIKPGENGVSGRGQIEGDPKAKEGEKLVLHRALVPCYLVDEQAAWSILGVISALGGPEWPL